MRNRKPKKQKCIRLSEEQYAIVNNQPGKSFNEKLEGLIEGRTRTEMQISERITQLEQRENSLINKNIKLLTVLNTIKNIEQYLRKAEAIVNCANTKGLSEKIKNASVDMDLVKSIINTVRI